MFQFIRSLRDRQIIRQSKISSHQWEEVFAIFPLFAGLTQIEKQTLRELAIVFMHRKVFTGKHGLEVTQAMAMLIALQACLPILKLGLACYQNWYTVIVYPSTFVAKRVFVDEAGVEHNTQSELNGEAWYRGPVVLAWDETEQANGSDGENLVIHEFAHKLDMQNGVANGFPPLHAEMDQDAWVSAFTTGYDNFQGKCERGENIGIDCYAATSPAEFFAVFSEVFFARPDVLLQHYVDIYHQLVDYYRQDPYSRL